MVLAMAGAGAATDYPIDLDVLPSGFERLADEPVFDPAKHLALEKPDRIISLKELGYDDDEIANCPSDFGATTVFRVLSDEGVACLYDVIKQMEPFVRANPRIERCLRGGIYRSRFLRDLCLSPDITAFLSEISGIGLMPHTVPHQVGHVNFNPTQPGEDVDKWHVDTLRYDYVMFVTDPKSVSGGAFQYFKGTKHEIAALKAAGKSVPADRIIAPDMPGAGYAVMQQGNMVVHQAKGLTAPGERITMVNGYIPADPRFPDYMRYDQLALIDPEHVITSEFVRHVAHRGRALLDRELMEMDFSTDREAQAKRLEEVAALLQAAAGEIRDSGSAEVEHFGG